jgi:hypothetical protein
MHTFSLDLTRTQPITSIYEVKSTRDCVHEPALAPPTKSIRTSVSFWYKSPSDWPMDPYLTSPLDIANSYPINQMTYVNPDKNYVSPLPLRHLRGHFVFVIFAVIRVLTVVNRRQSGTHLETTGALRRRSTTLDMIYHVFKEKANELSCEHSADRDRECYQ